MPAALHGISDALPLSYAVDGMHHPTHDAGASGAVWADIAIVVLFAAGALAFGGGDAAPAHRLSAAVRALRVLAQGAESVGLHFGASTNARIRRSCDFSGSCLCAV
jgi:hypothetical protein